MKQEHKELFFFESLRKKLGQRNFFLILWKEEEIHWWLTKCWEAWCRHIWTALLQSWSTDTLLELISTDGSEFDSLRSVLLHHTPKVFPVALYYLCFSYYPSPLLAETLENWLHSYSTVQDPVPKQLAEEKKLSPSTEKLSLSSRKLPEECSQSLYC